MSLLSISVACGYYLDGFKLFLVINNNNWEIKLIAFYFLLTAFRHIIPLYRVWLRLVDIKCNYI